MRTEHWNRSMLMPSGCFLPRRSLIGPDQCGLAKDEDIKMNSGSGWLQLPEEEKKNQCQFNFFFTVISRSTMELGLGLGSVWKRWHVGHICVCGRDRHLKKKRKEIIIFPHRFITTKAFKPFSKEISADRYNTNRPGLCGTDYPMERPQVMRMRPWSPDLTISTG